MVTTPVQLQEELVKTVLYWNSFFNIRDFTLGFGRQPMIDAQCRVDACSFTDNRTLFNQSDVVVFSFQNMSLTDLPLYRFPHQRFVFYEMESPENTDPRPMEKDFIRYGFFNWSMTYRLDSDIVHRDSYGIFTPHQRDLPARYPRPSHQGPPSVVQLKNPSTTDLKGKKKLVAWFVSHCPTQSRREDYVNELSRHIQVDIYGKCSNMSCTVRQDCFQMLRTDYKFYIGFENSLCPDYVTEKLTRALLYDTVPIVFGGVDYTKFAPPHSYIDVKDFASPKQLADYLHLLDRTDDLYARYFDWKNHYSVKLASKQGWCHLCRMAHNTRLPVKVYTDLLKWWKHDAPCSTGYQSKLMT